MISVMNSDFLAIWRKRLCILLTGTLGSLSAAGQQASASGASLPKAQQVPQISGRAASTSVGSVTTEQDTSNGGSSSSVDTLDTKTVITNSYRGSIPDPNASRAPLTLNIADAIRRALLYNLAGINTNSSVKQLRGERLAALSQLLPQVFGTLSESGFKVDLETLGFSQNLVPGLPLPSTVGPFHFYAALANVSESVSMTSLYNLRESKAALSAAQLNAEDARQLIILAVSGTYLQLLATKARVVSQEVQVKQSEVTYRQAGHQFTAGTQPVIDRNRNLVEFQTEQERLSSLRGDLAKQTMRLARLIGLPVGQVLTLVEDLPPHVPDAVPLEDAVKLALEERSDLKAAKLQLQAALEARRASRSEYLPSVAVSGNYGVEGVNPNKGASVFQAQGEVNIPIFQSGRVRADIEQADAAVSLRQAEYADQSGLVELDVRQAYVDLQVATGQVAVAEENRKVAAQTLKQSQDRFEAGVTNSVEVVQSQESVAAAERDYISSLYSLNLARISLARATGQVEQLIPNMLKGN